MALILQDAYEAAQRLLDERVRPRHRHDIVIGYCAEYPTAWVFGYNTRRLLVEKDLMASLVGNGPVIVPKSGSMPYLAWSDRSVEEQLGEVCEPTRMVGGIGDYGGSRS